MTARFPRSRSPGRSRITRLWCGSRRAWRRFSWRYAMATEPMAHGLLRSAGNSAAHMEMRDSYTPDDQDWLDWQAGRRFDPEERWASWSDLIRATVARGVSVRRIRLVSEPVTDYIRFEYDVTADHNI